MTLPERDHTTAASAGSALRRSHLPLGPAKEERAKVITTFVNSILNNNISPIVPANDVFDVMSVCFAAEKAMNNSTNVKVNYI